MFFIIFVVVFLFSIGFYFLYYQPKMRMNSFTKQAQKLGYKVLQHPYKFMNFFVIELMEKDQRSLKIHKEELKKYDLIVGNIFTRLAIIVVHPDILKDVFNQSIKIQKNPLIAQVFQLLNRGGIPFAEGQEWKRKRRIISSVFHYDFSNQMIPDIESQLDAQFKNIDQKIGNGQSVKLYPSISKVLSSIVAKCFFGSEVNQYKIEGKSYCEYYNQFLNQLTLFGYSLEHVIFGMRLYNLGLTARSRKLKQKLDLLKKIARQITQNQLERVKKHQQTQKNIITALYENNMLTDKKEANDPNKYTIDELIGEFFAFFAAGTDTTSNLVNLMLHYLSENAVYIQKIDEELKDLKQKGYSRPEQLKNMKWIQALTKQALRINGPAAQLLQRVATHDILAGGLMIRKNTNVSIFPILCHYKDQDYKDPFEFLPQRWLENASLSPFAYIPFSAGQRSCIGQYLAKTQAKIIISKIIEKYKFKATNPIKMRLQWVYTTVYSDFDMELKVKQT